MFHGAKVRHVRLARVFCNDDLDVSEVDEEAALDESAREANCNARARAN